MSRYCPIVDHRVTYQFCDDCDDHKCRNEDKDKEDLSCPTSTYTKKTNRRGENYYDTCRH